MFSPAIAHSRGIGVENIRQGLRTFTADFFQTPGRLNFYNEHPFRVLLDYAHNAHGMQAMTHLVRGLAVHGRRIGVIAAPGDRRDEDIAGLAAAAAPAFDLVLVREDDNRRGRPPGEVGDLLRRSLVAAGFPPDCIAPDIYQEEQAVAKALDIARAGDQIVSFRAPRPELAGGAAVAAGAVSSAGPPAAAASARGGGEEGGGAPAQAGALAAAAAAAVQVAPARPAAAPALIVPAPPVAQATAAEAPSGTAVAPVWPLADRERNQAGPAGRSPAGTDPRDSPIWPAASSEILPDDFDD